MIIKFSTYINETKLWENLHLSLLIEDKSAGSGQASDTKGKIHELLTGYYLNGGKHMDRHQDEEGNTPEQAHTLLKDRLNDPEKYEEYRKRAEETANHIRNELKKQGKEISHVHWTSKPGDIKSSTGVDANQTQDASDIMIHTIDNNKKKGYTGVSLKVSDNTSKHVPVANMGINSLHPEAKKDFDAHREKLAKAYPEMAKQGNDKRRKQWKKDNPEAGKEIDDINREFRRGLITKTATHLKLMGNHELIDHIKKNVLQCNPTPLQNAGHDHMRTTTYAATQKEGGGNKFHSYDPSEHFNHILDGSKKIHVTSKGTTELHYHWEDENGNLHHFASQRVKANSNSDPFSPIKSSGIAAGGD